MYEEHFFLGCKILYNTKTDAYYLPDFDKFANAKRYAKGLEHRQMSNYFHNKDNKQYIQLVSEATGKPYDELIIRTGTGRTGGTWVHKLILLDIAMWFNARFKLELLQILTNPNQPVILEDA